MDPLTEKDRKRIRQKQDHLLLYYFYKYPLKTKISSEHKDAPTLKKLREFIYPEWEFLFTQLLDEIRLSNPLLFKGKE